MARHVTRVPNDRRIRRAFGLIRRVRGRASLEALYQLQHGTCAYDGEPCLLLLPQIFNFAADLVPTKLFRRFATIDHVFPRSRGGNNEHDNLVMASQFQNCRKDSLEPIGGWEPNFTHSSIRLQVVTAFVDSQRWVEAQQLATSRLDPMALLRRLVEDEVSRFQSDVKFYSHEPRMVA